MKIKVKSDESLFDEVKALSSRINYLAGLVQNDMELEEESIETAFLEIDKIKTSLDEWEQKARTHIYN